MIAKLKSCFVPSVQSTPASIALLILRLIAGVAMILHGYGKIQAPFSWMPPESGVPGFFQFLAALSEFGGGIAWIVGLIMPLASFGMLCTMIVATLFHAVVMKDPFVSQGGGSYEPALVYVAVSLLFICIGPGKFSIDNFVFKKR
jgi:putative oxidoreductase